METTEIKEQPKSHHPLVTIVIVAGMALTLIINVLTLLNCWSMIGYAQWEFGAFTHDPDIQEEHRTVFFVLLAQMLVAVVATVFILIYYIKLLEWKKRGFWGLVIASAVAAVANVMMSGYITKAFSMIDVDVSGDIPFQIAWTMAAIAMLYAVLRIKKNGVRCWEQLE